MMSKNIKEIFLYAIVGGIATLTEWLVFYILGNVFVIHYAVATTLAYIISTFINWIAGRILIFKKCEGKTVFREIVDIYLAAIIGLVCNLLIMFIFVDVFSISEMISKIIATAVVFVFNFTVRKYYIYK